MHGDPRIRVLPEALEKNARKVLADFRHKNDAHAIRVFAFDLLMYSASFSIGAVSHSVPTKFICGLACGVFIARLFVLGHDACHQSLTSNHELNRWIGRVSFLPSFTPYRSWELAHNCIHHVFSNWSQKDYIWAPFSKVQFDALPLHRRILERFYRHPVGHGLYYANEIWWKRLYFPGPGHVADRARYMPDSVIVSLFAALQLAFLVNSLTPSWHGVPTQVAAMMLLPFAVWNCLMGFTIFLHHTHPHVPWFLDREEWKKNEAQLHNTVHVEFAIPFDTVFHNIYKHTAHHLDVSIPFYRLPEAQKTLEAIFGENIVVERLTWRHFWTVTRTCRLYNYENHCWLDFDGAITAQTTPSRMLDSRSVTLDRFL